MIDDERCQSNHNDSRISSCDLRRLLEPKDLDEDAAQSEMHGHLVRWWEVSKATSHLNDRLTHLCVVLHGHVVGTRANADSDEAPVGKIDSRECMDMLPFVAKNSVNAVADVEEAGECIEEFRDVVRYYVVFLTKARKLRSASKSFHVRFVCSWLT